MINDKKKDTTPSTFRTCVKGHQYYKSSDCPICPVCEATAKPATGFLSLLSAPARRALQGAHIFSLEQLAKYSTEEILQLHGLGPSSLPKLKKALTEKGLDFKSS